MFIASHTAHSLFAQDVIAISDEDFTDDSTGEYKSLYQRVVDDLRTVIDPSYAPYDQLLVDTRLESKPGRWALRFYAYDRLTLMNAKALEDTGGWDIWIPYYGTDCDMYERFTMHGWSQGNGHVGAVYDVGSSLEDLHVLYRDRKDPNRNPNSTEPDTRNSEEYRSLRAYMDQMSAAKNDHEGGRNFWQATQSGGQGEPYYIDGDGFEKAIRMTMDHGGNVMSEKWGTHGCGIRAAGLKAGDEWRVEHDWDPPPPPLPLEYKGEVDEESNK
jgi:hypothetical protein